MGRAYDAEMAQIAGTLEWVRAQDTKLLGRAFQHFHDRGLVAIGSGGSLTSAAFAADLHFRLTGRASVAVTPLEAAAFPDSAGGSNAALLLSAEGKNKDILAAARGVAKRSMPAAALTLTSSNPLSELCRDSGAAAVLSYEMTWGKDGYLATNTLLGSMCLIWKAVDAAGFEAHAPLLLDWFIRQRETLLAFGSPREVPTQMLTLYGASGRIGGLDIESKMAEAAFGFVQHCDYRQFAHGRHLQLAASGGTPLVIALLDPDEPLGAATLGLLPSKIQVLPIVLPSGSLQAKQVAGVLAAFALTERWGQLLGRDPGQPHVPDFGRQLHALDPAAYAPAAAPTRQLFSRRKWASDAQGRAEAATAFINRLESARFRALVCDFDGTFCDTIERFAGLDQRMVEHIERLTEAGVRIAFATGRGDSLSEDLRRKLSPESWGHVTLGCLSGSWIFDLADTPRGPPVGDPRLHELVQWLRAQRLLPAGLTVKDPEAGQLGLRGLKQLERERLRHVLLERFAQQGFEGWRVLASGHSLDVLTEQASKTKVLEHLHAALNVDVHEQVLRLGDAGEHGGNDFELLKEGIGLSVDTCNGLPHACWNLLPEGVRGVTGTLHILQGLRAEHGWCSFTPQAIDQLRKAAETES